MKFPKIYCISLADDTPRRTFMREQLQALGPSFQLLDAIRYDLATGWPANYARERRLRRSYDDLCGAEIGCYLSHRKAWKEFIATDAACCIVLEDDVRLHDDFVQTVESLCTQTCRWEFVRFFRLSPRAASLPVIELGNRHSLVEYLRQPGGTQGYMLSRKAAERLLEHTETIESTIDDAVDRDWEHRLPMHGVEPPILSHENFASTLVGKVKLSRWQKWKRSVCKLPTKFARQIWILRKLLRHALRRAR